MVLVKSTMLPLGTKVPAFTLEDCAGERVAFADVKGAKATLVIFMCNHCPYVIHLKPSLAAFAREYAATGLGIVAINANDMDAHPADNVDRMQDDIAAFDYGFPYLIDRDQRIARLFRAACTPDFFLLDHAGRLAYRGQFDGSRPGSDLPPTGADLRGAVDRVLKGHAAPSPQTPSLGCNIKWKPGNEPDWFR